MKRRFLSILCVALFAASLTSLFAACKSTQQGANTSMKPVEEITSEEAAAHTTEAPVSSTLPEKPISTEVEVHFPAEMSMEELEEKLGFGYTLFNEDAYPGTIVSKYDDSLGETGGILLEYTFDGFTVYVMKYEEGEIDAYDGWETEYAERGSEVINGVEVRFRGQPMVPDYRGVAFWRQNGYQYILNCETAPGSDIMSLLPLFMEIPPHDDSN